jgi:hypothetical protein
VTSNSLINGEEGITFTYDINIANKLLPNSVVYLKLPKQNTAFFSLGATTRECLLFECDDSNMVVTVMTAPSSSLDPDTTIP